MKRTFAIGLMCGVLALTLAACGTQKTEPALTVPQLELTVPEGETMIPGGDVTIPEGMLDVSRAMTLQVYNKSGIVPVSVTVNVEQEDGSVVQLITENPDGSQLTDASFEFLISSVYFGNQEGELGITMELKDAAGKGYQSTGGARFMATPGGSIEFTLMPNGDSFSIE